MKKNKGFTLIELLVVIAIIGLLSTIVLVSLNSARNKAKDTRTITDLAQVRTTAELMYSDNTSYVGLGADSRIAALKADVVKNGGVLTVPSETATTYYACATLVSSTKVACVDSMGNSETGLASCPVVPATACK